MKEHLVLESGRSQGGSHGPALVQLRHRAEIQLDGHGIGSSLGIGATPSTGGGNRRHKKSFETPVRDQHRDRSNSDIRPPHADHCEEPLWAPMGVPRDSCPYREGMGKQVDRGGGWENPHPGSSGVFHFCFLLPLSGAVVGCNDALAVGRPL